MIEIKDFYMVVKGDKSGIVLEGHPEGITIKGGILEHEGVVRHTWLQKLAFKFYRWTLFRGTLPAKFVKLTSDYPPLLKVVK